MIVPRHWAEARVEARVAGKKKIVRRFGWSNDSEADAKTVAEARALEAAAAIASGQRLAPREYKVPYHGAEGVPIREEIIEEHGEDVITRNSYGALCLNTPDVLFADVDYHNRPSDVVTKLLAGAALVGALLFALGSGQTALILGVVLIGALWFTLGYRWLAARRTNTWVSSVREAHQRLQAFIQKNPSWRLRLYHTPAGLRILAMHRPFDPHEPEVEAFFKAIGGDAVYAMMCRNQRCFRARLTPKPWRIGVGTHLRPRPGVWPVNPSRLPERAAWVAAYDAARAGFAACRFERELGAGPVHPRAEAVRALHDVECKADSGLPIG